jgi:hypothetical protein
MKLTEIKATTTDLYSEINDAAASIGTIKELTSKVRDRVIHHLNVKPSLVTMDDHDIKSLLNRASGEEKFALRIAMKVAGRRDPSELQESKMPDETPETDDPYVVIGNWGRGTQTCWPKGEAPGVYTKEDAEKIVSTLEKEQKGKGAIPGSSGIAWHAKPLEGALEYVSFGNKAYGAIKALQKKHEQK